jgi:hypothetical protein
MSLVKRAIGERECIKERGVESREIDVVGRNIERPGCNTSFFVSAAAAFIGCRDDYENNKLVYYYYLYYTILFVSH